jgi:4-alpha-glucanotransferase
MQGIRTKLPNLEKNMVNNNSIFPRSSGVLLHPTSLPGRYGIGHLGEWAYHFVDWLVSAGQSIWQVLPLGPTSYGDSPYQSLSSFAGNPLLISFEKLVAEGYLAPMDLADAPTFPANVVDFGAVIAHQNDMLTLAYQRFKTSGTSKQRAEFKAWIEEQKLWLDDFALFVSLKDVHGGRPWVEWPEAEALRFPEAIQSARTTRAENIAEQQFKQWQFFKQWHELKRYANQRGVRLVGDLPIFVAHDSADVWAYRQGFYLDETGQPTVIAGVPPDYFSPTGQRWGNPLYRWDVMAEDGYVWWINRIQAVLSLVDIVRIDHFRGFEAYWEVPATEPTAIKGEWKPGPGFDFFNVIQEKLGQLPIIAEDLGLITPGVVALRDGFRLPGMKILQFAFGGAAAENSFLPHNYTQNCIVYTGTHDNNTTIGWWNSGEASPDIRSFLPQYIGRDVGEINWDLARLGMMSVAHTFVIPMQDVLSLGAEARMNTPGRESGNWGWRFTPDALKHPGHETLAHLTKLYGRWPKPEGG